MIKGNLIGIDVDGTVVDTFSKWIEYIKDNHGVELSMEDDEELLNEYLHFWEQFDLYDDLELIEDAKESIDFLSRNNRIVFISSCFSEHEESKKNFIKKHFPYADFIATSDKQKVPVKVMIDDYKGYLKKFDDDVLKIQIKNGYTKGNDPKFLHLSWKEIKEL